MDYNPGMVILVLEETGLISALTSPVFGRQTATLFFCCQDRVGCKIHGCVDTANNTFSCVRTVAGENTLYCRFFDDEVGNVDGQNF